MDIILIFREQLIDYITNPPERTMATFNIARDAYRRGKNIGHSNRHWALLGYPLVEPSPETWFD